MSYRGHAKGNNSLEACHIPLWLHFGRLLHPWLVLMIGDARNSNSASDETNEGPYTTAHQSSRREDPTVT